jgi:hypothetical protein
MSWIGILNLYSSQYREMTLHPQKVSGWSAHQCNEHDARIKQMAYAEKLRYDLSLLFLTPQEL